ncbi:MAG TPA: hypothetical protein VMS17_20800 [Gemmataceae bacterium]|nr:hypothetical protein [Gemmataceae bacterium]
MNNAEAAWIAAFKRLPPHQQLGEVIAAFERLTPDQRQEFEKLRKDEQYRRLQTEYDLQQEQRRMRESKPANEGNDYGIPEWTP